ncbi:ABC transporter permease subunit [Streptomyces yaanensis]|uniref:ABC transporter permease subunit n=1 Tax=Streptomyces yaanensis TaxID=1142239 RepID=A0ABV7S602_9ACTN|nr:ABC transporter permease subunit [Streptomyces sp. CGMCC 4.7035]WNB99890.1 ABC transporter permease subunit [Streptomyces sp. CGMCC 4.7035]
MTTASSIPATERHEVTQLRVIHSEWIKLRSLRSTLFTLLAAVVAMTGLGCLFSYFTAARWDNLPPQERLAFDPTLVSLRGIYLAQLAIGVLGVLVVTGEYATGMIRASLSAVPRRLPVLWAKALVYAAVAGVLMTVAALAAFLLGQATLSGHHLGTSLSAPGVPRAVLGAGLYLTVVGLIGVALGALIRNTAGGIATLFGVLLVLPALAQALPSSWLDAINPYLPSTAGQGLIHIHQQPHTLAPWTGFAVFCLYALVALAGAGVALKRRDA